MGDQAIVVHDKNYTLKAPAVWRVQCIWLQPQLSTKRIISPSQIDCAEARPKDFTLPPAVSASLLKQPQSPSHLLEGFFFSIIRFVVLVLKLVKNI